MSGIATKLALLSPPKQAKNRAYALTPYRSCFCLFVVGRGLRLLAMPE